jgi:poly(glycerol-phosphate) alpha-glucosyltransferase
MLEPWAVSNSKWKKTLAGMFYENEMLHGAACLQANTRKEYADLRSYGLKNPVCVIPNGVHPVEPGISLEEKPVGSRRVLLFLGRIHPKKGLVNALKAWANLRKSPGHDVWQFVIAGWDQRGHETALKMLCLDLGLSQEECPLPSFLRRSSAYNQQADVVFVGPAFGKEKEALLGQADAFILPSFSEGLPMAVLEAWAHALPVVMTDHCNLPEGFSRAAAIRIGTEIASLCEGLRELREMPDRMRGIMGRQGRTLVMEKFTWPRVAAQMKEVYEWVLGGGDAPACVVR